jgi:hypothetical protein
MGFYVFLPAWVVYNQSMKKTLSIIAVIAGIGCLVASYIYFSTPANMLPAFMPGFDPSLMGIHTKHAIAALVVGLGLFIFAWFYSGKKKSAQ